MENNIHTVEVVLNTCELDVKYSNFTAGLYSFPITKLSFLLKVNPYFRASLYSLYSKNRVKGID
jgi:hypothetical protein